MLFYLYSEMFFGRRWREDVRYHSPMASLKVGHVFIYDFVKFLHEEKTVMGRVSQFVHKVKMY